MIKWLKKLLNYFRKKDLPKALNEGKIENETNKLNDRKIAFIDSLKVITPKVKRKTSVETIECFGDGTGLDNTMEC